MQVSSALPIVPKRRLDREIKRNPDSPYIMPPKMAPVRLPQRPAAPPAVPAPKRRLSTCFIFFAHLQAPPKSHANSPKLPKPQLSRYPSGTMMNFCVKIILTHTSYGL